MSTRPALLVDRSAVVRVTGADVLDRIGARVGAGTGRPLAVCSVNVDHLHHFGGGRRPLGRAVEWLFVADGAPVARRGAMLTRRDWPRVTGADLLPEVIAVAAARGWPVGFFGGTPIMHRRLERTLSERYPELRIAGFWSPERAEVDDHDSARRLARAVRDAGPAVLVVGLGKPRQEQWIDELGPATGADVLLPFGAAADFLAGMVERAPERWQRAGAEWLYRLIKEPRRLARRYLLQGPPALIRLRSASLIDVTWPSAAEQDVRP
ncbi:WecB/TagA/CpsF family glycosyltransferase [Tsukamurella sp. 1534]|uniref:WecB/TagA/CpsF family glycosyltransferase n=1 Tax=Tsukamurella sp. 1534 TaxID=1151061 RepID=UPI0002D8AD77|nr:WecB/TagA/CpsF family glycosyltransferase [Tsukamurella sp. 1534]